MRKLAIAIAACFLLLPQAVFSQDRPVDTRVNPVAVEIMPTADDLPLLVQQKKETPKPAEKKPAEQKPAEKTPVPTKVAAAPFKHLDGKIIVFAADGSGDWNHLNDNLRDLLRECRLPVCLQQVKWCRFGEGYKDHNDHEAQLRAALELARVIKAVRNDAPRAYIFLVGHSSGTRVVLAAAEAVPPGAVDRIFLLAPSVSCSYDLRGALRGSRGGIVSYFSREDVLLENAEEHVGTADGLRVPTAGRVGFSVPPPPPGKKEHPDAAAYKGLKQVMWRDGAQMGHGNHYGWVHQQFLRAHLIPQFFTLQACN